MVGPRETELTVAYGILAQPPGIGDDGLISIVGIVDNSMDDKDTPVYERPPAPPNCTPSNTAVDASLFNNLAAVFCSRVVPGIAIVLSLDEKNLNPVVASAKIKATFSFTPPRDGSSLGCGLLYIDIYINLTSIC